MNLFRAAMHPVSFCTSFMHVGAFMLVMTESASWPLIVLVIMTNTICVI
jgi:hypothetical protein